ncbi:MAG: sulfotransferase, partial [Bradymonadaceae bacterium]
DIYEQRLAETFRKLVDVYDTTTQTYDYERWGAKAVWLDDHSLPVLRELFPRSKFIFLYRDIQSILESLKGQQRQPDYVWNLSEAYEWKIGMYYQTWEDKIRWARETLAPADDARVVQLEAFLSTPEQNADKLCAFLGIDHLDLGVLDTKVNSIWHAETGEFTSSHYVSPSPLSDSELKTLRQVASTPFLRDLGYDLDR